MLIICGSCVVESPLSNRLHVQVSTEAFAHMTALLMHPEVAKASTSTCVATAS